MIELTFYYPAEESASAEYTVFSADYTGHLKDGRSPNDLSHALPYVEEALSGIDGILSVDASDGKHGDLSVAYDFAIAPWKQWYIAVIDAIKAYYADAFNDHTLDVVSSIQACRAM